MVSAARGEGRASMARLLSLQEGIDFSGYLDRIQVAKKMQRRLPQGMIILRKSPENNGLGHMRHHRQQPSNNSGLTLNQRVQGSNPCTPTKDFNYLAPDRHWRSSG
jgi:hypothetical protein